MNRRLEYGGYFIQATQRRVEDDGIARWTTECRIERHSVSEVVQKAFESLDTWESEIEAIEHSLALGRQIIDGQHPRLSPP